MYHGPRLRALDARHGGSLIDAQLAVAPQGRWPPRLLADVATVRAADFTVQHAAVGALAASLDLIAVASAS